jgi:hypothetical protein
MSPSAVALTTIFAIVALGSTICFLAGVRRKMDLEKWTVGGRGFGPVLMYLLMAGETYTTFSLLAASGWACSRGGPTYSLHKCRGTRLGHRLILLSRSTADADVLNRSPQ